MISTRGRRYEAWALPSVAACLVMGRGGTDQDELAWPAPRDNSRDPSSEPCSSAIVPQMTVLMDLTSSEAGLTLIPECAVGTVLHGRFRLAVTWFGSQDK